MYDSASRYMRLLNSRIQYHALMTQEEQTFSIGISGISYIDKTRRMCFFKRQANVLYMLLSCLTFHLVIIPSQLDLCYP
jgi:hypothetical protein